MPTGVELCDRLEQRVGVRVDFEPRSAGEVNAREFGVCG